MDLPNISSKYETRSTLKELLIIQVRLNHMINAMINYEENTKTVVLKLYPASESSGGPLKHRCLGPGVWVGVA